MADNVAITAGSGTTIAADDIGGVLHQRVKISQGADGAATDVSSAAPLQVTLANTGANATPVVVDLGANNDVTVTGTVTANLAAGTNNIGDVDVLTVNGVAPAFGSGVRGATVQRVTIATDDVVPASQSGTWTVQPGNTANTTAWKVDGSAVTQPVSGTVTANLAAGTNNIGDVDVLSIAAGDNNIGNVDIVTMPNVTLAAGTNTNEVVGDIAHDTGVGGNPVLIAGAAQDMDDTAPPNRVSAESDTTRLATDRDGSVFAHPHGPQVWSYHLDTSSAQTDASVHAAPGAGLSLYVTDIVFSSGSATAINLFFEEGASKVLGPYYLEAVAGRGMAVHFQTPKKITANTALTLTTSAAIAHAVDVTGFVAQG